MLLEHNPVAWLAYKRWEFTCHSMEDREVQHQDAGRFDVWSGHASWISNGTSL